MIDSTSGLMGIGGISPMTKPEALEKATKPLKADEASFADVIGQVLDSASAAAQKANELNTKLQMDDPTVSLEQAVLASNMSSLQFTAVVQARNKIMQAYTDVMNMPV